MARENVSRGMRDEANVGPDPQRARDLRPMKDLDRFKVADGEPDIRGWAVWTSAGRELGVVEDLLVDVEAGEVVMLDVDLKRDDRHTLAPIRAAWVDRATKRVVLDAREVAGADTDAFPSMPRRGALTDQDVEHFNDRYVTAYGDRGYDADRDWQLRHGDEDLRFSRRRADLHDRDIDRQVVDRHPGLGAAGLGAAGAAGAAAAHHATSRDDDRDRLERERLERDRLERERHDARYAAERGRVGDVRDAGAGDAGVRDEKLEAARRREVHEDITDDLRREGVNPAGGGAVFGESRRINEEMRGSRVDDASALPDDAGIEPRELDARTRLEEGGRVDAGTPVGGVTYDSTDHPAHAYGRPEDRYGPGAGSGRIGFDRVVSRQQRLDAAAEASRGVDDAAYPEDRRRVRYPSHLEDTSDERRRRALDDLDRR
jgi:sporulation protein YlmC with PRC-barrel domain